MTTAEEIAELAGVCRQTVSAVVNGRSKVCREKRNLILKLAEERNYRPDPNARSLSGNSVRTIGLVIPSYPSLITYSLMNRISDGIRNQGYQCYTIILTSPEQEREAIREFTARKMDGMIAGAMKSPEHYRNFSIPTVILGAEKEMREISVDYGKGMELALRHLHRVHGHRNIVFLTDRAVSNPEKYQAYRNCMSAWGLPEFPPLETAVNTDPERRILSLVRDRHVTAFAGTGDIVTGQFLNLCHRLGIRIPEDAAVTGYDGTFLSSAGMIQLSGTVHPVQELADQAVSLLFRKIRSGDLNREPRPHLALPCFFRGETCGCSGIPGHFAVPGLVIDSIARQKEYQPFFER